MNVNACVQVFEFEACDCLYEFLCACVGACELARKKNVLV